MKKRKQILSASGAALLVVILLSWTLNEEPRQPPNRVTKGIDSSVTMAEDNTPGKPAAPEDTSPPEEEFGASEKASEEYDEQRAAFLEEVEPLFGTKENRRGVFYGMVVESLDKESVPFLRELLEDESYKDRWAQIAMMIAMVSDRDDEESVRAIVAYIRRANTWSAEDQDAIMTDIVRKGGALKYLGLFESDLVNETLQDAFTEGGAKELISPWLNVQTSVEPRLLVVIIRAWAARGLVLTRDPENIALVEERYESLSHKMLTAEYREQEMTLDLWLESELHLAYAAGMAEKDMLTDMGVEEFVRLRDNSHRWAMTRGPYTDKYMGEWLDDERTIMKECPICGKVAE